MLEQLHNEHHGIDLRPDRVAATMLYAFYEGKIIGRFHIRHSLNAYLLHRGGNVGYAVAKPFQKRGVGMAMMTLGLKYAREQLKLEKILVTCADDNVGSTKLIENSGGVLENKVYDAEDDEMIRRYWIG
jgi:predicted acetyltransferase